MKIEITRHAKERMRQYDIQEELVNSTLENPDSILVLRDSTIILDGNYSFTQGAIIFQSMVEFAGTYTFQYTSNMTSTIAANSMLKFDVRSIFNYAPTSAKRKNDVRTLFEFTDFTSKLFLNGSTLSVTDTGMYLNGGVIVVDHNSKIVADGTTISDGVVFGDNLDIVKTTSFIIYPAGKIIANNVNNLSQYVTLLTP